MSIWQDLRFALRLLNKDRWFAFVAAGALALGIAVNSVVFTLVNAVLIRGIPFEDADRIMALGTRDARNRNMGVSFLDFEDWRRATRSFSNISLLGSVAFNVSEEGRPPEQYQGTFVSGNLFDMLGQPTAIGRGFKPEDDRFGAPAVTILGHGIWQTRYGGDVAVLGRTIKINDLLATVIGVMPEGMRFPNTDLWLPLSQSTVVREQGRQIRSYQVLGRLADGVTADHAREELTAITAQLARDYPDTNKDIVPRVTPFNESINGPQIRLIFLSLMGAVGFVLLIACANVANLLLARAAQRGREISVRMSLGASRWRIVRQLLVESVLLACMAGLLSFPLSVIGIRLFDAATQNVGKPYWMEFTLDPLVYAFFAVVCVSTGIIFGLAPALHVSRTNVNEVLREGGRSGSTGLRARRWTSGLVIVELALTLVLLAGAGFMMRSFLVLYRMDLGIDTSRLVTMQLSLPARKYRTSEERNDFIRRVDERLGAIGAIEAATTTSNFPFGGGAARQLHIDGRPWPAGEQPKIVTVLSVGPRYFDTIGLRMTRGRMLRESDGVPGQENAVANQRFAAMYFAGEDPIGRRIRLTEEMPAGPQLGWLTIVGVAPTVRQRNPQDPDPDPVVYIPFLGNPNQARAALLLVRTQSEPAKITGLLREEIRALDPDMPLFNIRTMDENLARQRWPFRVFGSMFAIFAFIALVLSAVGLYAVTAYSVSQRTQEIGIRMALGAQQNEVWRLFLRRAFVQLAIGFVLGMPAAVGVGRLLQSLLVQTSSTDLATLGSIAVVLAVVGVTASLWPARRATRLDPLMALRYE